MDDPAGAVVAPVRGEGIGELMSARIGERIGIARAPEQVQIENVPFDPVAVLAVVQESDATVALGEIDPFVRADLEPGRIPACVPRRGPLDTAELDVEGRPPGIDAHGE